MDALIIIAHGSKMESSNKEIINLVDNIREKQKEKNILVLEGFLELSEPSIFHALNKAVLDGAKTIKIFPYFLAEGKHVKEDIPNEIKKFKKKYPEIEFIILPHLGKCEGIEEIVISNSVLP